MIHWAACNVHIDSESAGTYCQLVFRRIRAVPGGCLPPHSLGKVRGTATYIESGRGGRISQLSRPFLRDATRVAVLAPGPMTVRALPAGGTASLPGPGSDPTPAPFWRRHSSTNSQSLSRLLGQPSAPVTLAGPLALVPPCSRRDSRRASELGDGVGMAVVELGEGPCRESPPLDAVHGGLPPGPVSVQDSHRSPLMAIIAPR